MKQAMDIDVTSPASSSSSSSSVPLRSPAAIRRKKEALVRIIHLDCGEGGDCTVIIAENQFIVIDGGKIETGKRLVSLLTELISQDILPFAFIVSHFDGDHYLGLFYVIQKVAALLPERYMFVVTPADEEILNSTVLGEASLDQDKNSNVAMTCAKLKRQAPKVRYLDPSSLKFSNGWQLILEGGRRRGLAPSSCNDYNDSSLQWILQDGKGRTQTTYYTGGDALNGPLAATIVKLDHHGSTVDCNSQAAHLREALYWVIMGAGRTHKHPGLELLDYVDNSTHGPNILLTHHHFDDEYLGRPNVFISREHGLWGDIGFSLYRKGRILADISATEYLRSGTGLPRVDEQMAQYLKVTRTYGGCDEVNRIKRGQRVPREARKCEWTSETASSSLSSMERKVDRCPNDARPYPGINGFGGGYACDDHRAAMRKTQQAAYNVRIARDYAEAAKASRARSKRETKEEEEWDGEE